jgi:soluble cytochrome b562
VTWTTSRYRIKRP